MFLIQIYTTLSASYIFGKICLLSLKNRKANVGARVSSAMAALVPVLTDFYKKKSFSVAATPSVSQ